MKRIIAVLTFVLCSVMTVVSAVMAEEPEPAGTVDSGGPEEGLDTDSVTVLDEFVIVQQQKLVQSDGAKLTYNVSEDPEAKSSSVLDILRKVPGVTVDAEDNVRVNGQNSFRILMNGADNPMLKGDLKTILKSLPAHSLKKIEVISEPGAKYDAEGAGGILNIVTDSGRTIEGYLAQASLWGNAYMVGGNVTGKVKLNKVMLGADVTYNNGRVWPRSSEYTSEYEYHDGGPNKRQTREGDSRSGWDYVGADIQMSWEPDTLNLFTATVNFGHNKWSGKGNETRRMYGEDDAEIWSIKRREDNIGNYDYGGGQVSYQHNFGRQDHNIVASYMLNYRKDGSIARYFLEQQGGESAESPFTGMDNDSYGWEHIFQADYNNRFNSRHLLEAGGKISIDASGSDDRTKYGATEAEAVTEETSRLDVRQFKDIYALYASYTGTFGRFSPKAGLRYEHTRMGLKYRTGDYPDFTTRLNDIVPNAALSCNFTPASSLRLAYQMRISRPGLGLLNPYVNDLTPGQIRYGNPDLKSEHRHNVTVGYTNYDHKFSGGAKVTYSNTGNWITNVIFMKDNLLNTTYANAGTKQNVTFELNWNWNILPMLQWGGYFSADYAHMKANSELFRAKARGWQYAVSSNVNYTLPANIRFSAYGGYNTGYISLQTNGIDNYYYGLGLSKSFLKDDALEIQLSANNFLPPKRNYDYSMADESVVFKVSNRTAQWNVGVSISYRIGGLTAGVKKTAANVETDMQSGSRQDGGSGGGL